MIYYFFQEFVGDRVVEDEYFYLYVIIRFNIGGWGYWRNG